MIRKILGILLAFSMIASSIGYHVVHHHCFWCGGDRVELISLSGGDGQEESCCHKDTEGSNDDCDEDACCRSGLLKIDKGLASEDGQLHLAPMAKLLHPSGFLADLSPYACQPACMKHSPAKSFPPGTADKPVSRYSIIRC